MFSFTGRLRPSCVVTPAVLALLILAPLSAQDRSLEQVLAQIRIEAFQHSKVMETAGHLTDVHAMRLANSPGYRAAAEWCRQTLAAWGFDNARLEPYGSPVRGWHLERFSAEMTTPYYMHLTAYPRAFSRATDGVVRGQPVKVEIAKVEDLAKYKGKLKGALLLNGRLEPQGPGRGGPESPRMTDEQVRAAAQVTNPGFPRDYWEDEEGWNKSQETATAIRQFMIDEGVAAVIEPSRAEGGAIAMTSFGWWHPGEPRAVPLFVVAREQYGRLWRLLDRQVPVTLELSLTARFDDSGVAGVNVIAEIPGTDPTLKDEVVMMGGHLDAIPPGAGAMDDGGPCVIMMEALRVLKAAGVRPRRTIRIGLWDGEEIDYYGSLGYVKAHYGDPETLALKPEHAKLAAYFNLDSGIGRIRGVNLQGNEAARGFFEEALKPWAYLGASTVSARNRGSMDHIAFDSVGLPAFPFIQDSLDYGRRVHTNLDVYEGLVEEEMQQAAAVIAGVVYQAAMRDEPLPRKAMPTPRKAR